MEYINHFGDKSSDYLQFRPDYPNELYSYLSNLCIEHDCVWDCGTGNGQAAFKLARYFDDVVATDINQTQLDVAIQHKKIHYHCWPAERTKIRNVSVDLITVAQALHWFNLDNFYSEVRRVAKPEGIIAAWCYSLGKIKPDLDVLIERLYSDILGDTYWPKERRYIDAGYHTIPFPFERIHAPYFAIDKKMNFSQLIGYLNTWSAVKEYKKQTDNNPIDLIYKKLELAWGDVQFEHTMHWPIHLLVGKITI